MSEEKAGLIAGGCNCGAVRYKIEGAPLAVAVCHCTHCRKQSGSAFAVNLVVKARTVTIEGPLASYVDTQTESGKPVERQFCSRCGSPIRSVAALYPALSIIKAGTADDPSSFVPTMHVWTESKLPWVDIPAGIRSFPRNSS